MQVSEEQDPDLKWMTRSQKDLLWSNVVLVPRRESVRLKNWLAKITRDVIFNQYGNTFGCLVDIFVSLRYYKSSNGLKSLFLARYRGCPGLKNVIMVRLKSRQTSCQVPSRLAKDCRMQSRVENARHFVVLVHVYSESGHKT